MQTLLKSQSQLWVNHIQFGFKNIRIRNQTQRNHKYYASQPLVFQKYYQIKNNINWKEADLTFPINIPLKQRYSYQPKIQVIKATPQNDFINPAVLSGNEILLYLEQTNNLRVNEILDSLDRLHIINKGQFKLMEHPWVKLALDKLLSEQNHLTKLQFIQLINIYDNYGNNDQEIWKKFQERTFKYLPNMKAKQFSDVVRIFLEKDNRATDEFKKELSLILPVHLKKMSPIAFAKSFELMYKHNLMTDYLFFDHLHHIFWKRLKWFLQGNGFSQMLRILREANFENCEFIWPDIYKTLEKELDRIPNDQCQPIKDELILIAEKWQSHSEYNNITIIKKIASKATWEATLGGQSRKLSLAEIVQNDILYYKEKQKLLRSQNQASV